ncbi:MAG: hypothetical protein P8L85_00305 [Rubripirellula sp.]|nr:hypothetical protein [Rubripirellula sp.]
MSTSNHPPQAESSDRPVGVTIFAVLHLLFAASGLLSATLSLVFSALGGAIDAGSIPIGENLDEPAYRVVSGVLGTLDLFLSIALFAAGLGLLKMRTWARQVSLVYAVYAMIAAVVSNVVQYSLIYRPLIENVAGEAIGKEGASVMAIVLAVAAACIGMIYPFAILIYFARPGIKRKFTA